MVVSTKRTVFAWLYVHGCWPETYIDHINGDRADNRIANLRDVPQSVNAQNARGPRSNNKTGFLGVSARHGKFRATIRLHGKYRTLGYFGTAEAAHAAYLEAKRALHLGCTI